MDFESMSIEDLEAHGNGLESQVVTLRREQLRAHDIAEQKRNRLPIVAGPLDQVMHPGTDLLGWLKGLPPDVMNVMRNFFKGEK